jgi:hypothetical protein
MLSSDSMIDWLIKWLYEVLFEMMFIAQTRRASKPHERDTSATQKQCMSTSAFQNYFVNDPNTLWHCGPVFFILYRRVERLQACHEFL